jgi:hypothetical protein
MNLGPTMKKKRRNLNGTRSENQRRKLILAQFTKPNSVKITGK